MRVYEVDDYDRALVSGFVASEEVRRRWERDVDSFRDRVGRYRGRDYLDRFSDMSRALDIDVLERRSLAVNRKVQSAFRDNILSILDTIGDFQHASSRNQDYLLADPYVNYKARNGHIEGWGRDRDEYSYRDDEDPVNSPYYRAMYDGVMRVSETNPRDMYAESYLGQTEEDMERLSYHEKMAAIRNVELIRSYLMDNDSDPTSKMNNKM